MVGISSFIPFAPELTSEMLSILSFVGSVSPSESFRQSGKRKAGADSRKEDELDPTILGKLLALAAIAAASIHKYWTSAFGKIVDNAELTELLKLAEMYTSRSHVLNCELYKVLAMKVNELRSTVGRDKDVNALHSKNKDFRE
ncbi:hypothetical protein Fot_13693 [Forsythia ovata]|uniref:Uncharacterized protein n=1 Tax=Forsythia ovata TaxID=205694 RepID=A0ABD1W7Q0_9LAMI